MHNINRYKKQLHCLLRRNASIIYSLFTLSPSAFLFYYLNCTHHSLLYLTTLIRGPINTRLYYQIVRAHPLALRGCNSKKLHFSPRVGFHSYTRSSIPVFHQTPSKHRQTISALFIKFNDLLTDHTMDIILLIEAVANDRCVAS